MKFGIHIKNTPFVLGFVEADTECAAAQKLGLSPQCPCPTKRKTWVCVEGSDSEIVTLKELVEITCHDELKKPIAYARMFDFFRAHANMHSRC